MPAIHLSPAEQRVLAELATAPDTHAEIAERLHLTHHTVNAHITSMFEKTGAKNQVQLLRWAFREALQAARPTVIVVVRHGRLRKTRGLRDQIRIRST